MNEEFNLTALGSVPFLHTRQPEETFLSFSSRLCVNAVSPRRLHTGGQEADDGDGGVAARSSISYN